jgi:5-methylcytosine-specific restriction endonuclease McrA
MKRLNPNTGLPFKRGDLREDGRVFKGYKTTKTKRDGYYIENWVTFQSLSKQNEYNNNWKRNNPEKHNIHVAICKNKNPSKYNALKRKHKSAKIQRTPPWLSAEHWAQIEVFYKQAYDLSKATGVQHHVDHIVPLRGQFVSGLHVPWNMQVLTASENCSKSNRV